MPKIIEVTAQHRLTNSILVSPDKKATPYLGHKYIVTTQVGANPNNRMGAVINAGELGMSKDKLVVNFGFGLYGEHRVSKNVTFFADAGVGASVKGERENGTSGSPTVGGSLGIALNNPDEEPLADLNVRALASMHGETGIGFGMSYRI